MCNTEMEILSEFRICPMHRYLTYQNFYASVKMLNFWCEFSFWKFSGKSQLIIRISDKNVTSKNKGKKSEKSLKKITKWKKLLKFICHGILLSKIPLKFVIIF